MEHGADPNEDWGGVTVTPLEVGAIHASTDTLMLLLEHGAEMHNTSAWKFARYYGRVGVVEFLLNHGAKINELPDNDHIYGGGNALHTAAGRGTEDVVALLIDRGADPSLKNSLGKTALELAEGNGHSSVASLLRRAG